MLASIHPLGERARRSRWGVTVASFVAGSTIGGSALGLVLGGAGAIAARFVPWMSGRGVVAVAIAIAIAAGTADLAGRGRFWPTVHRQVNDSWLMTYRGWVYGGGFGFQLGLGITTIVTTAAVHATVLLAFLVASPMNGAMVGATFGLARAVPILAGSRVDSVDRLQRLHRTMQGRATAARVAGIVVLWAAAALVGVGLAAA